MNLIKSQVNEIVGDLSDMIDNFDTRFVEIRGQSELWWEGSEGDRIFVLENFIVGLTVYRKYVLEHCDVYLQFPMRLASYWDPVQGLLDLRRDVHLVSGCVKGLQCPSNCVDCANGVPQWSRGMYIQQGAYAFGFFEVPELQLEIMKVVSPSDKMPLWTDVRIARGGVSLRSKLLDEFYNRYFGCAPKNSLATERCFSELLHRVFVQCVSNIRQELIENKLSDMRGVLHLSEEELKAYRAYANIRRKETKALEVTQERLVGRDGKKLKARRHDGTGFVKMALGAAGATRQRNALKAAAKVVSDEKKRVTEERLAAKRKDCECCGLQKIIVHPRAKKCTHLFCDRATCRRFKSLSAKLRAALPAVIASGDHAADAAELVVAGAGESTAESTSGDRDNDTAVADGNRESAADSNSDMDGESVDGEPADGGSDGNALEEEGSEDSGGAGDAGSDKERSSRSAWGEAIESVLESANSSSADVVANAFKVLAAANVSGFAAGMVANTASERSGRKRKVHWKMAALASKSSKQNT